MTQSRKKCSAFFSLSARHSRDNFLASLVTTHSFAVRALTALQSSTNAHAFSDFLSLAPAGCSDKFVIWLSNSLRSSPSKSTEIRHKNCTSILSNFFVRNRYTISIDLFHKSVQFFVIINYKVITNKKFSEISSNFSI